MLNNCNIENIIRVYNIVGIIFNKRFNDVCDIWLCDFNLWVISVIGIDFS